MAKKESKIGALTREQIKQLGVAENYEKNAALCRISRLGERAKDYAEQSSKNYLSLAQDLRRSGDLRNAEKFYRRAGEVYELVGVEPRSYTQRAEALENAVKIRGSRKSWLDVRRKLRKKELEPITTSIIAVIGILGGIFFLSSNITGNAVGNLTNSTSNIIGAGLLVIGLVAGWFWMKKK